MPQMTDPKPDHELEYQSPRPDPVEEVADRPLRWAVFLAVASVPVWLCAGVFVANIHFVDSLPHLLHFRSIASGSSDFPNISGAFMLVVMLVLCGTLGLAIFVMSLKSLAAAKGRRNGLEVLLLWFSLLSLPAAAYALMKM